MEMVELQALLDIHPLFEDNNLDVEENMHLLLEHLNQRMLQQSVEYIDTVIK
jgi:hypothetical protein